MRAGGQSGAGNPDDAGVPGAAGDSPLGLAELRQVDPPPSLVAGVMRRIAEPAPPSLWRWLRRPMVIELRFSRLGATASGLAVAAALALLLTRRPAPGPSADPVVAGDAAGGGPITVANVVAGHAAEATRPVLVRLRLQAKGARRVAVAGSFNEWSPDRTWLVPAREADVFVVTLALPPGVHEYMFVVDGRWISDPNAEERRPDGFGRQNSLLRL